MRSHIELIGRLSAEPEFRQLPNGDRHAFLRVETIEQWKDRTTGARQTRSTWHDVRVSKAGIVKAIERHSRAGDLLFVSGSLRYREWTDGKGTHRKTADVAVKGAEHQFLFLSAPVDEPPD
jgi:single-strand DNA-binding protein